MIQAIRNRFEPFVLIPGVFLLLCAAAPALAAEKTDEAVEPGVQLCVSRPMVERTVILDDQNILFYMRGKKIYLNKLPRRCFGLRMAGGFGFKTSQSVLCNVDLISVLRSTGTRFEPGVSCGLGKFHPTTREEIALLREIKKASKK